MGRAHALCAILALCACEPADAPVPPATPSIGELELAVGTEVRKVEFAAAVCETDGDTRLVQLVGTRPLAHNAGAAVPKILIARTRGDNVTEAHAFAANVHFGKTDYSLLHVHGGQCRLERSTDGETIICNEAEVVGWLEDGPRPRPSYRVKFRCPA